MVDLRRFELPTPTMRMWCAPSCATSPYFHGNYTPVLKICQVPGHSVLWEVLILCLPNLVGCAIVSIVTFALVSTESCVIFMKTVRQNMIRAIIASSLRTLANLCFTGTILQTFLASLGFSSTFVYINATILSAANVTTTFLFSRWADKGSVIKRAAIVEIPHALLYLLYIPICLWKSASLSTFLALTGICLLQTVCTALYTVCEYKVPYVIFNAKDYGTFLSFSGIVSSLLSLLTGALISWLTKYYDYAQLMLVSGGISAALMLTSALLHRSQKSVVDEPPPSAQANNRKSLSLVEIFKVPVFLHLIPANFLRGFSGGVVSVFATIALSNGQSDSVVTSMVSYQAAAALVGCFAFGFCIKYLSPRLITLLGSLAFLLAPLILVHNETVFLAAFTLIIFGRTLVEYAVPALLRFAVPAEIAGPYNAWRMVLYFSANMLATTAATVIPVKPLLILTAVMQVISGICFFGLRIMRNASPSLLRNNGR